MPEGVIHKADVLIIGAGASGLMAWKHLHSTGVNAVVLEARDRVGGRIHTIRAPAKTPVELGAEFVHGRPPASLDLLRRARLQYIETPDRRLIAIRNGALQPLDDFWEIIEKIDGQLPKKSETTYAKFLKNAEGSPFEKRIAKSFVEGFNAARAEWIGTAAVALEDKAASKIEGERQFRVTKGYDALLSYIVRRLPKANLHLQTVVKEIRWKTGYVEVYAHRFCAPQIFCARRAIITLPLGVLRASRGAKGFVRFKPALPQKTQALKHLEMGHVQKIIIHFKKKFWSGHERLGFIMEARGGLDFPVWWPREPGNFLTGWAGGPAAERLMKYSEKKIEECAFQSLAKIFAIPDSKLKELAQAVYHHDWTDDPFSLGAYSYQRIGGIEAARALARPVKNTLFFAGEATDSGGHSGTVHAALESGIRAAKEIIFQRK